MTFYDNRINIRQNNTATIQQLVNYIYSTVEISKFKYKIIDYESDLNILTKQKHYLSANFNGINCLLVFTKIKDKYMSFLVDRKTLTYNINQIKIENVKTTYVNIKLDNSIYNGTIFDGIYINNKRNRTRTFVITDVYYFLGKNITDDDIKHKFMNVTEYLKSNMKTDNRINNLKLSINKLYEPSDIRELLKDMEKSKSIDLKGIVFYPNKSGTKLIFLNTDRKHDVVTNSQSYSQLQSHSPKSVPSPKSKKVKYIAKNDKPIYAVLEIRKTKDPDVYKVFALNTQDEDGIKFKKLGIASIPNTNCSVLCRNIFENKKNDRALMKCLFNNSKNKWIPLEEEKVEKRPIPFSNIEKYFDIVDDDDDNETD